MAVVIPVCLYLCFTWQSMSAKEKLKFEDMAKNDKVRYDREMKNYVPPKGAKGGKRKKDPNAPKRPPYVDRSHNNLWSVPLIVVVFILTMNVCFGSGLRFSSSARITAPKSRVKIQASLSVTSQRSLVWCGQMYHLRRRPHMSRKH